MPNPCFDFAACVVGSDIYVFGGTSHSWQQRSVFKYETETDEWSTLTPMPGEEHGISALELDGLIYVVGVGDIFSGLICYDPTSEVWSILASLTYGCTQGLSYILGGCLYAAGGHGSESKVQRYNVTTNAWTEVANMLEGRTHFGAVAIGYIIVTSSVTPRSYSNAVKRQHHNNATVTCLVTPRYHHRISQQYSE
jgi:hypothetical protein